MKLAFAVGPTVAALFLLPSAWARTLEVQNDHQPRSQAVIIFDRPPEIENGTLELKGTDGSLFPVQQTPDGRLSFILPKLAAGAKMSFTLGGYRHLQKMNVTATEADNQIQFSAFGKPVVTYQTTSRKEPVPNLDPRFLRGGYLHPIFTPSGKIVTDDYPANHLHHHGIWTAWTKAEYDGRDTDFWNMGQGKGRVDFVSVEKTWSGPVEAGFISTHRFTDLTSGTPVDILNEQWTVRIYAITEGYYLIDLTSKQTVIGNMPLLLPEYHYGGIGLRGRGEWDGKTNATFLNSEAVTSREGINGHPTKWVRMTGRIEGSAAGMAILSSPENFRAPQPVRVNPTEPFLCVAPQIAGPMEIKPGETYHSRYRLVIADGEADSNLLDALWHDYAKPLAAVWKD